MMITTDVREAVLFVALVLAVSVLLWLATRHNRVVLPPAVAPQSMPIEEQMRDVRHRVANFEQHVPVLQDHAIRLRGVEREVAEVRGTLTSIVQGQQRIERQLDMLTEHHVAREKEQ